MCVCVCVIHTGSWSLDHCFPHEVCVFATSEFAIASSAISMFFCVFGSRFFAVAFVEPPLLRPVSSPTHPLEEHHCVH